MKNNGLIISLIILLSIIAILLTILLIFILNDRKGVFNFNLGSSNEIQEEIYNKTYEKDFPEINIDADAANIYIKNNSTEDVKVIVFGKEKLFTISDISNLDINLEGEKCIGICFKTFVARVEVYLPSSYSGEINIDNKFGNINVDNFMSANINIHSSYGDSEIKGVNSLDIKSSAGDIIVKNVNRLKAENNYGNIEVEQVNEYLDIHADCGDIKIDEVNLKENSQIKNNLGDIKISRSIGARIDAKTSLGDTKVNDNDFKSDIILSIDNNCGNIKVN